MGGEHPQGQLRVVLRTPHHASVLRHRREREHRTRQVQHDAGERRDIPDTSPVGLLVGLRYLPRGVGPVGLTLEFPTRLCPR